MEKKKKIFLVEDDSAIADVYSILMRKEHFDVEIIESGGEVLKKIKNIESKEEEKPDIILLDLILPDMNGMEILKELKKNNLTKDITAFILTNQEESVVQKIDGVRPDKFIIKANTTPTQLVEIIKQSLK